MATLNTVLAFSRAQAQTDSNGLNDANGIIYANEALLDFHRRLIDGGIDASQVQEAYRNATDGSGNPTGTFLYPSDMFFLKAIEANYLDTTLANYVTATQVDASNIQGLNSFSWLRQYASRNSPQFDDRGDWFEMFPTFTSADNVTNAIRIIYFKNPTEFTATTDTVSYPGSLDYRILGWRIASDYLYALGKADQAGIFNAKYEERVKQIIETLGRGVQQPIQAKPVTPFNNGWNL